MTKSRPPLDDLAQISRQFPTLKLQVEWDQPGDERIGCATIENGTRDVLELDDLLRDAKDKLQEVCPERLRDALEDDQGDAEVALRWEMWREACRLYFGGQQDEQKEENEEGVWAVARDLARQMVRELFAGGYRDSDGG
jgi:hypothetical protein